MSARERRRCGARACARHIDVVTFESGGRQVHGAGGGAVPAPCAPTKLTCFACKTRLGAERPLDGCRRYLASVRTLSCPCPRCGEITELQVENGAAWLGHLYAGKRGALRREGAGAGPGARGGVDRRWDRREAR